MQRLVYLQSPVISPCRVSGSTVGLQHSPTQRAPRSIAGDRCVRSQRHSIRITAARSQVTGNSTAIDSPAEAKPAPGGAKQGALGTDDPVTRTSGRRRRRSSQKENEMATGSSLFSKAEGLLAVRGSRNTTEAVLPPEQQLAGSAPTPPALVQGHTLGKASRTGVAVTSHAVSGRRSGRTSTQSLQHLSSTALLEPTVAADAVPSGSHVTSAQLDDVLTSARASTDRSANEASRSNPILRAICIVQLRSQQLQNSAALAGTAVMDGPGTATRQQEQKCLQQQQQERLQDASGAATDTAAWSTTTSTLHLQRPRAALPADEVLMTETSHMNPVYRRIRLQELRLKLQQRLRGPQLQQQLLQAQQQQQQPSPADAIDPAAVTTMLDAGAPSQQRQKPRAALPAEDVLVTESSHVNPVYRRIRLQELRLRLQQPASPGHRHLGSSSSASAQESRSSSSSDTGTHSRGLTQGLNSVQRAIRMAQLQRSLQQRQETSTVGGTCSDRSRAGAAAGSATAAAPTPWFLPATEPYTSSLGSASRSTRPRHSTPAATAAAASDAPAVMQQLVAAGVPIAAASEIAGLGASVGGAVGLDSQSHAALGRILQLQQLLGLPSVAAAAKTVIKQPNLLKRDPQALRHNVQDICKALQLPQPVVQKMLARYPAALDMNPASVACKVATLATTLDVPASQAVKVACACPRVLGMNSETLSCKVTELQSALEVPSKVAAVSVVLGFPSVLGISTDTLAEKYQRLKELAQQRQDWQQQLLHMRQHKAGSLGRVLAAGPRVVERLQYILDANEPDSVPSSCGVRGENGSSSSSSSGGSCSSASPTGALADGISVGLMNRSSVSKGGVAGGNLAALLIMSEAAFISLHPEFGLWRLKQRSIASA